MIIREAYMHRACGYTRELEEKHGLVFNFSKDDSDVERALDKAVLNQSLFGIVILWGHS